MRVWRQPLGLWLALAAAAALRLFDLDLIEFKGDEAVAIHLALPLVEGVRLPLVGLMSSVGVHNPPLFIYLVSLPASLNLDARFVTGGLIGLCHVLAVGMTFVLARRRFGEATAVAAALLFACAPWAVLYGRKLWAQDVLPPVCAALLWACVRFWERPNTRAVALLPVLLCALFQLHYSAVGMIAMSAVMLLTGLRRVHVRALVFGVFAAGLMLAPYLAFQVEHDYSDLRGLANMASGKRANGKPRKHEKEWTVEPVRLAVRIATDHSLAYAAGPSLDDYTASRTPLDQRLADVARHTGIGLLALGCLVLAFGLRARHPQRAPHLALAFWVFGYLAAMSWLRLEEQFPHYFIILYPGTFLLMALPIGWLWQRPGRASKAFATLLVALVLAGNLTTLHSFHRFVRDVGGTAGDYGVAYRHKAELARWAVAQQLPITTRQWEFGYLYRVTNTYGDDAAIAAILARRGPAPPGAKGLSVFNRLWRPHVARRRCAGRQDFGPLVVCPHP